MNLNDAAVPVVRNGKNYCFGSIYGQTSLEIIATRKVLLKYARIDVPMGLVARLSKNKAW